MQGSEYSPIGPQTTKKSSSVALAAVALALVGAIFVVLTEKVPLEKSMMDSQDVVADAQPVVMGREFAETHSYEVAYTSKRCANFKIDGQWTRTWTSASSVRDCLNKCTAAGNCDYISFNGSACLYNTKGCHIENTSSDWKTYKAQTNTFTYNLYQTGKRCGNYRGDRVWGSANSELECFAKCQNAGNSKCDYFAYQSSTNTCLYNPTAGCSGQIENTASSWSTFITAGVAIVSYEKMYTKKRCGNYRADRVWTSADSVLACKNKCLAEVGDKCDFFSYRAAQKTCLYNTGGCEGQIENRSETNSEWVVYRPVKNFCKVSEELEGRDCDRLWHDTGASSSQEKCAEACCDDETCGVWQYTRDSKCMREISTHQSRFCGLDGSNIIAGARLLRDETQGVTTTPTANGGNQVLGGKLPPSPPPLPEGSPPSTAWPACWIDSYGRGVGEPLSSCHAGLEKNGALCYDKCKSGYYGVGPVCWERCPSGWNDGGVFCNVWMHTVGASNGDCPWYDKCGLTFSKGCTKCRSGYANHGCLCTRAPKHMTKSTYGRGAGYVLSCRPGTQQSGALCYDPCGSSYKGVGPVCWGQCPSSHPHKCGPLMCTRDSAECSGKILNLAKNVFLKGGLPGLVGIVDELCIPKCGDQRHMACTIVGQVNDALSICPLDITKCPEAFKCISFLGKRAEIFAKGVGKLMSGGALKDFNSFFNDQDGLKGCIKASSNWFQKNTQGCDVQKDGSFKEFAKCSVPLFKGFFMDDFSMPSLYMSIGGGAILGIVGGGTTFDVNFAFDGTIIFSYTKCNTLSIPDASVGLTISMGLFGNKNNISGESYVLAVGAGIPGTDIGAGAEVVYSADGESVIAMGANFGVGAGIDLNPIDASCSNCDTTILGCTTTLEEIGLGYLMN